MIINRRVVLEELKKEAWQKVYCYSANYLMTEPKDGMQEDWETAVAKAKVIDRMLNELPIHCDYDEVMKRQRYFRKYVGRISAWSCDVTRTDNPHSYVSLIEFTLDGISHYEEDSRLFRIKHELGIDYILSGKYDIERHERYDEGKDSTVQITVDSLGYIQEMQWFED